MKFLKKYNTFNEEVDFEVNATDTTNIKKSKEDLSSIKDDVAEYNKLKPTIDSIYKNAKSDDEIETKVNNLLGKDKENRNHFLVSYLTVADDERNFKKILDSIVSDKLKIDEYKDLISISDNVDQKKSMQLAIDGLSKKISNSNSSLAKLKADSQKRKKNIESNVSNIMKDMKVDIENIIKNKK